MKRYSQKLSPELRRLLNHCETNCYADCCHESAFDISENRLKQWFETERIDRTVSILNELNEVVLNLEGKTKVFLDVRDLESEWEKERLVSFLKKLRENIKKESLIA